MAIEKIRERIEEIESDERIHYVDADVQTNAPLALHQVSQKRALRELKWVESVLSKSEDSETDITERINNPPAYHKVKLILEYEYDEDPRTAFRYALPIKNGEYAPSGW